MQVSQFFYYRSSTEWPPGPRGRAIIGVIPEMKRDMLGYLTECQQQYGDIFFLPTPLKRWFVLLHPRHIEHILVKNPANYVKSWNYGSMRHSFGRGLIPIEDGAEWRKHNRMTRPVFKRKSVDSFEALITSEADALIERWERATRAGETVDVFSEMKDVALNVVVAALFGFRAVEEHAELKHAFLIAQTYAQELAWRGNGVTFLLPRDLRKQFAEARALLDDFIARIIAEHRAAPEEKNDLLSMLMVVRDDDGVGLSDQQLRDELMTLVFAGHETSANALAFSCYLLAQKPQFQQQLQQEVDRVLGDRAATVADVSQLEMTQMVLEESMRLYPPVWSLTRVAVEDDEIDGYQIPKGALVQIVQYLTHRHPDYWDKPEEFNPMRFSSENRRRIPHSSYFPFLHGPRRCLGKTFAMTEAMLVLSRVAQRFEWTALNDSVELAPLMTLSVKGGIPLRLTLRKNKVVLASRDIPQTDFLSGCPAEAIRQRDEHGLLSK